MTNDAAVAFVDDSAGGVVAESRLAAAPGDWGESQAEIAGRRDATTVERGAFASSRELLRGAMGLNKFHNSFFPMLLTKQRGTK